MLRFSRSLGDGCVYRVNRGNHSRAHSDCPCSDEWELSSVWNRDPEKQRKHPPRIPAVINHYFLHFPTTFRFLTSNLWATWHRFVSSLFCVYLQYSHNIMINCRVYMPNEKAIPLKASIALLALHQKNCFTLPDQPKIMCINVMNYRTIRLVRETEINPKISLYTPITYCMTTKREMTVGAPPVKPNAAPRVCNGLDLSSIRFYVVRNR